VLKITTCLYCGEATLHRLRGQSKHKCTRDAGDTETHTAMAMEEWSGVHNIKLKLLCRHPPCISYMKLPRCFLAPCTHLHLRVSRRRSSRGSTSGGAGHRSAFVRSLYDSIRHTHKEEEKNDEDSFDKHSSGKVKAR